MKIILTDAATISRGDLDLSVFSKYGEVTIYDITAKSEAVSRIADADAILMNKTILDADVLSHARRLRYIGTFATGYNTIDTEYCRRHNITVCNAGTYSTDAVAETVFAYILNRFHRVAEYSTFVSDGGWIRSGGYLPLEFPIFEMSGRTLGIVGYGAIGHRVAELARAFRMRVLVYTRTYTHTPSNEPSVEYVSFEELLGESDIITCHCPLTKDTAGLFDKAAFGQMKAGAYFINTSRGGVIDESALFDALESERLAGAAIDVLTQEPMHPDCVLYRAKNLTITPHIAWAAYETRQRLMRIVEDNLQNFIAGAPTNVIV